MAVACDVYDGVFLCFFPRGVLDEILNLIESVSEGFPSYSSILLLFLPLLTITLKELIKSKLVA